jgi:ribonuclease HII
MPDFRYERQLWEKGFEIVAGMDEVGRGALAGPVVAGAVVFATNSGFEYRNTEYLNSNFQIKIDDSKKLTARQREEASRWIKEKSLGWGIGVASVSHVNSRGIISATNFAFRSAIRDLQIRSRLRIHYLLIDAFYVPYIAGVSKSKQRPIIKGDEKSLSIAAASIIAKVYRDKLMTKLSKGYNFKYGWGKNKGYGTKEHRDAILKHGISKHHRRQFLIKLISGD